MEGLYNKRKLIIDQIKNICLDLARVYNDNIKIEINTNLKLKSVKLKVTENH